VVVTFLDWCIHNQLVSSFGWLASCSSLRGYRALRDRRLRPLCRLGRDGRPAGRDLHLS
jgi:hypothetical protein